ncbi:MAG TPA: c-type cytochrome [Methylomirabilota bacterium]|nr:c-type cytochrome [Methylomirabilota bacterium]
MMPRLPAHCRSLSRSVRTFPPLLIALLSMGVAAGSLPAADSSDSGGVALEALKRLEGIDLDENPAVKQAVLRVLENHRGRPVFVQIVKQFDLRDHAPELLEIVVKHPATEHGVEAMRLLLTQGHSDRVREALSGSDPDAAIPLVTALGLSGAHESVPLLEPLLENPEVPAALRKEAVVALSRTEPGARTLLDRAEAQTLPADVRLTASTTLASARWPAIRDRASELLPPPASRNAEPLPPIAELVQRQGDPIRGREVFDSPTAACVTCHQVRGRGVDFGPDLSEIGDKLGKDALYEAILDPNAGVSFGYEAWQLDLKSGDQAYGIIVSETEDEIAIKNAQAIVSRFPTSQIVGRVRMEQSIMPAGLQMAMTPRELVDLVEYLASLKKAAD